jgi:hypothetical protein
MLGVYSIFLSFTRHMYKYALTPLTSLTQRFVHNNLAIRKPLTRALTFCLVP